MGKKTEKLVNEGLFSDLSQTVSRTARGVLKPATSKINIASRLSAFLDPNKQLYGATERERLAARKFITYFANRGVATLDAAVKYNLVDPNSNKYRISVKSPAPAQPPAQAATQPPAPAQPPAQAATQPPAQAATQPPAPAPTQTKKQTRINKDWERHASEFYEDRYTKLNRIFENYISELDKIESLYEAKSSALPSISQYFYDNFLEIYLPQKSIPRQPIQPKINEILKNLPNLYKTKQLHRELEQLAHVAWTLSPRVFK